MKIGLVLGGGGVVGLAYHAGVLHALEEVGGFAPDDADVIVGTSAGSVIGAYLRTGWSTEDFWQLALGTHPTALALGGDDPAERRRQLMAPAAMNPVDLVRRGVGSAYVLSRSFVRLPVPQLPSALRQLFPGGMFANAEGRRRFAEELPDEWPERSLWLTAVDIGSGRRVVLGRDGGPPSTLQRAVMASCAIPGVYQPVRVGGRVLVDGGVHSSTNLDLAVAAGCDLIIGVAPMAFDTATLPGSMQQLVRRMFARSLAREVADARTRGAEVLLVRPSPGELRLHGLNMMRPDRAEDVARAAYESTAAMLATDRFRSALGRLAQAS